MHASAALLMAEHVNTLGCINISIDRCVDVIGITPSTTDRTGVYTRPEITFKIISRVRVYRILQYSA